MSDYTVTWDNEGNVITVIDGVMCTFPDSPQCIVVNMLSVLIEWRQRFKRANPDFSFSIKVASNSLFGALGFPGYPLYSPRVSASVPLIGSWSLSVLEGILKGVGLYVL